MVPCGKSEWATESFLLCAVRRKWAFPDLNLLIFNCNSTPKHIFHHAKANECSTYYFITILNIILLNFMIPINCQTIFSSRFQHYVNFQNLLNRMQKYTYIVFIVTSDFLGF